MPRKKTPKTKSAKKNVLREARAVYVVQPKTSVDIGSLIARNPKIRSGRPCIAGTGVSVMRVAGWYKMGHNAEEIADKYGHLSLAQVYAALAYYHANRDEIEADMAEEAAVFEKIEQEHSLRQHATP